MILTIEKTILERSDIWDTDNADNWEPEFMTIFVTWQLIVTLDSIRNSGDVFWNLFYESETALKTRLFLHQQISHSSFRFQDIATK